MQLTDTVNSCKGRLHLEIYKAGRLVETDDGDNLVIDMGRSILAGLIGGKDTGKYITHIGVGSNAVNPDYGDTGLSQQYLIQVDSATYDGKNVRFDFVIGNGDANGLAIREYGLFFNDGRLFSRRVRQSTIGKESDIEIKGYWEIRF